MAGIFVSYRRDDSQGFAGRLADDLTEILGPERVFRDIEIPAGSDFTDVLHRAIAASDLLLIVIGRGWAATSAEGYGSRLFEPADWVRTEIEAAFAQGKQVVPVLVAGAPMPDPASLPASIRRLSLLQAAVMSDRHWDREVIELAERITALCPGLGTPLTSAEQEEDSPAKILREIGEEFLEQVASRRRPRLHPPRLPPSFAQQLMGRLWRGLSKFLGSAVLLVLVYIGMRLFGDESLLRMLDAFDARLLMGWERLQNYLQRI